MSSPIQIALITGANTGVGEAVARSLALKHEYHVIIGSRNLAAGTAVTSSLQERGLRASAIHLDLADEASIQAAARTIETDFGRFDVLVNSAAVFLELDPRNAGLTLRQRFEQTFVPNLFGQADITEAVLPLLRKASVPRIVFVSSRLGSLANALDPKAAFYENDFRPYNCSKASLNVLAINYARMLDNVGGLVNVVCPGLVKTRLSNYAEAGHSPEVGAERIVQMATLGKEGPTRTFSDRSGLILW
ncbi:short-chain dehydrogenase [Hypoxylon trugodes]|uniref:short-chain dehydrogenase n=1 Tax=Hypoxylon trugodes TaxID=326681 RepID=UPI0021984545|nr:short-chain dehydrogenase [Hypoxylon trugodes]KAI1391667.1 short-chain dehydrogenase [Hypoxylon trugodes]